MAKDKQVKPKSETTVTTGAELQLTEQNTAITATALPIAETIKEGTTSMETITLTETAETTALPVAGTSPVHAAASAEVQEQKSTKLAGLLAKAKDQQAAVNEPAAAAAAAAKAPRGSVMREKITSAKAKDPITGASVRRFNSNYTTRQVVAIVSEKGKLAHITTDINYAKRTPAAAAAKAYAELCKQVEIAPITKFDDIVVTVIPGEYRATALEGEEMPECQAHKARVYDEYQAKGYTMLGRVRRPKVPKAAPAVAPAAGTAGTTENAAPVDLKAAIAAAKEATAAKEAEQEQQADAVATTDTATATDTNTATEQQADA